MKVIGSKIIEDSEVPMIVECTSMEISGHSGLGEKFNPDNCRICMRSTHPSVSFFIIKTERYDTDNPYVRPFKWLSKNEAEAIMKCAAESDVVDLRKLGNYQICSEGQIQSVMIMNDIDDWSDEERPILVKLAEDSDA